MAYMSTPVKIAQRVFSVHYRIAMAGDWIPSCARPVTRRSENSGIRVGEPMKALVEVKLKMIVEDAEWGSWRSIESNVADFLWKILRPYFQKLHVSSSAEFDIEEIQAFEQSHKT